MGQPTLLAPSALQPLLQLWARYLTVGGKIVVEIYGPDGGQRVLDHWKTTERVYRDIAHRAGFRLAAINGIERNFAAEDDINSTFDIQARNGFFDQIAGVVHTKYTAMADALRRCIVHSPDVDGQIPDGARALLEDKDKLYATLRRL